MHNIFKQNEQNNQKSFEIIKGENKVIISAPHSKAHYREGRLKFAETYTGEMSASIAKRKKINAIYKTKEEKNDANWDKRCEYKSQLEKYIDKEKIKCLVDLHGMSQTREEDICIGVAGGKNIHGREDILNNMIEIFEKDGFKKVTVDIPFDAVYEHTVCSTIARKCKIPCFQIEINYKFRNPNFNEYSIEKIEESIERVIQMIIESV